VKRLEEWKSSRKNRKTRGGNPKKIVKRSLNFPFLQEEDSIPHFFIVFQLRDKSLMHLLWRVHRGHREDSHRNCFNLTTFLYEENSRNHHFYDNKEKKNMGKVLDRILLKLQFDDVGYFEWIP
jgi:hypothetical protein